MLCLGAGTDVTERRANPLQPALGARMTFVARPHTPSNYHNTRFGTTILLAALDVAALDVAALEVAALEVAALEVRRPEGAGGERRREIYVRLG